MGATVDWALYLEYVLGSLVIYAAGIAMVVTLFKTLRLSTGRSPAWTPTRRTRLMLAPRSRMR